MIDIFYKEFREYFDSTKVILSGVPVYDLNEKEFFIKMRYYDMYLEDFSDYVKLGIFYLVSCENEILKGKSVETVYGNLKNLDLKRKKNNLNLEFIISSYYSILEQDEFPSKLKPIAKAIQELYF